MRIETHQEVRSFKPVTITIVLENQTELDRMLELSSMDASLPDCASNAVKESPSEYKSSPKDIRAFAVDFLTRMYLGVNGVATRRSA